MASAAEQFAARLRELVSSPQGLAKRLKVSRSSVYNWTTGGTLPRSRAEVQQLERALLEQASSQPDDALDHSPVARLQEGELVALWDAAIAERRSGQPPPQDPKALVERPTPSQHHRAPPAAVFMLGVAGLLGLVLLGVMAWRVHHTNSGPTGPAVAASSSSIQSAATPTSAARLYSHHFPDDHSHEIAAGGYVEQEFVAATPLLDQAGVIIGYDAPSQQIPDGADIGPVQLQLLDQQRVAAQVTQQAVNNKTTVFNFGPVRVVKGRRYRIRVTNMTEGKRGFYFAGTTDSSHPTILKGEWPTGHSLRPGREPHAHPLTGFIVGPSR